MSTALQGVIQIPNDGNLVERAEGRICEGHRKKAADVVCKAHQALRGGMRRDGSLMAVERSRQDMPGGHDGALAPGGTPTPLTRSQEGLVV